MKVLGGGILGDDQQLFRDDKGFIIYKLKDHKGEKYCEIDLIRIDKSKLKQGHGSVLLQGFLKEIAQSGISEFYLDAVVVEGSKHTIDELIQFYEKHGFEVLDRLEDEVVRVFMYLNIRK